MTVYVIITASLIDGPKFVKKDFDTRKPEYIKGISTILSRTNNKYNTIIVENNSMINSINKFYHKTFLDSFKVPVFYTTTNKLMTRNYGRKELIDINKTIIKYGIQDEDFVVKVTGRYFLTENCPFFDVVDNLENKPYSAVVRFGSYTDQNAKPINYKRTICGLIGMKAKYIKQMELPDDDTFVEQTWADKIMSLPKDEVCELEELGIEIRPGGEQMYFKA